MLAFVAYFLCNFFSLSFLSSTLYHSIVCWFCFFASRLQMLYFPFSSCDCCRCCCCFSHLLTLISSILFERYSWANVFFFVRCQLRTQLFQKKTKKATTKKIIWTRTFFHSDCELVMCVNVCIRSIWLEFNCSCAHSLWRLVSCIHENELYVHCNEYEPTKTFT